MTLQLHYPAMPERRPDLNRMSLNALLDACWAGKLPAEVLEPQWREQLVYDLWLAGWTDAEVAAHTYMSTYTAGRIRDRLGLTPNVWKEFVA